MRALLIVLVVIVLMSANVALWVYLIEKHPRKVLTNDDVKLYREAAKILNRLFTVTDLDPFDSDILSQESRKAIEEWLTAYKKELKK